MRPTIPLNPTDSRPSNPVPVIGISEWMCYYANYDIPGGKATDIDECIDIHLESGIQILAWNVGRSVVDYWSELPNTTRMCEVSSQIGGKSWAFAAEVMNQLCPLRRAIEQCHAQNVPILGRLGMNRHYGSTDYAGATSRFALEHPEYRERSKLGNEVSHRLCYAIDEVQQERLDILLEVQRIGVDGLVLDFCRQMPICMYHPAFVEPYIDATSVDPREIDSDNPDDSVRWFQYRADVLTRFMRRLRDAVRQQEQQLNRPCPIIARVPDNAPWLMVAYGLDVERWFAGDLIDGTMLSPFPITIEDLSRYPEYHISLAHRYGKVCYGGIGSMNLIRNGVHQNTGFFHQKPVYQMAERQLKAGADAMSLYQSETLVRMDYLTETLQEIGDPHQVKRRASDLPQPSIPPDYPIGLDWHSKLNGVHSLRVRTSRDAAL
jgi:hypothetical protein